MRKILLFLAIVFQVNTATGDVITIPQRLYVQQSLPSKLTDPDASVIKTVYNGWGQLVRQSQKVHLSGDSVVTTYSYHPSGLIQSRLRNGETTSYGYDNRNRLNRISIKGRHGQSFTYDQYDRLIQTTDTINGSKFFVSKTDYDLFGRVSKETCPSGYFITNKYDKYGYLTGIVDMNNTNIWNAVSSNAKGQLTAISQGGRTTLYGYDARGLPTSISGSGFLNMSYSFTGKGNLDYRQDNLNGYKEVFAYDSLNRLTDWTLFHNNVQQSANSLTYHPVSGLITAKSDLDSSVLNYGEGGRPPHALTSLSDAPALINFADQDITYTDFKKVSQITEADNVLNITYGVGDQRIKTVLSNPSGTLTRYYVGNYEEEFRNAAIRKIHYINGGNGLSALYVQNGGLDTLYYAHTDYQGSLLALSLANGTVRERYAYDPWGNRRNPSDWTQPDTRTSIILHRGYTLHEHLPEFKLINMNGRVYDPLVSQFLSQDPYLQAPGYWLNYNPYAYCFGNPLIYIDENGEYVLIDDLIAAAIGGIVNVVVNAFQGNIHSWGQGFSYFGIGAAGTWAGLYAGPLVSGAIIGAGNSFVTQGFGSNGNWNWSNISGQQTVFDGIMGGLTGQLGSSLGSVISPYASKLTSGIGGKAFQQAATEALTGSAVGFTMNTGFALIDGSNINDALNAGGQGALSGLGIGAATGLATGMRSAFKAGENPWTGEKVQRHHSNPIFLGGNPKQKLSRMNASDHRQLHRDLNDFQYEQRNTAGEHMRPQSNNSGFDIQRNFTPQQRQDAMKSFYDSNKWKYPGARYDFYRNTGLRWWIW